MVFVSLFASAVRQKLWFSCLDSLKNTSIDYEVVFAGDAKNWESGVLLNKPHLQYIKTGHIKPAQCYEIARRECRGDVGVWMADDCEFKGDIIGQAYRYWNLMDNEKLILSLQMEESGIWQDMRAHRIFGGGHEHFPIMAPIAMISLKFLEELGGFDKRYVCGQYENDVLMRAYEKGARVQVFGNKDMYVELNHHEKSVLADEITSKTDFESRPFATGYGIDRMVLERSWCRMNEAKLFWAINKKDAYEIYSSDYMEMLPQRSDEFQPYEKDISLTVSEGNKGIWQ